MSCIDTKAVIMERQAAYDLLKCFLEKRGLGKDMDLGKGLTTLFDYGKSVGCFHDPEKVFELAEWRKFGDILWEQVIDGNKQARKLARDWRCVIQCIQRYAAEQRVAAVAKEKLNSASPSESSVPPGTIAFGSEDIPSPPSMTSIHLSQFPCISTSTGIKPSAPPDPRPSNSNPFEKHTSEGAAVRYHGDNSNNGQTRGVDWKTIYEEAIKNEDYEGAKDLQAMRAFPVVYTPNAPGGLDITISPLNWKLLSQLRQTVADSGIQSEPTKQMLNYIWGSGLLLIEDIKSIVKLILMPSQLSLWQMYWQEECQDVCNVQRGPGDPLAGVTLQHLMGIALGPIKRCKLEWGRTCLKNLCRQQ